MKRLIVYNKSIIFLTSSLLIISIISCDTVVPSEKILKQNPDWLIFAPDYYDFEGISFNLDNNKIYFKYKTRFEKSGNFFNYVDSIAILNEWRISKIGNLITEYRKKSNAYPAADFDEMVSLTFKSSSSEILFHYKPEY